MTQVSADARTGRLLIALSLFDAGIDLQRQRIRRQHPELASGDVEMRLRRWIRRDGEPLDAPGRVKPPGHAPPCTH